MSHAAIHTHIVANIDEGIITVGLEGEVLDFNPAAAQLLGMAREAVLGQPFGALFLVDERNDAFAQAVIDAVYEAEITHNRVVRYHRADATVVPLALSTSFLRDEGHATRGVIAVFRDISELERLREEQRRLNEELQGNNHRLAAAVLEVEEANASLQAARQRGRVMGGFVVAAVALLGIALAGYLWQGGRIDLPRFGGADGPPAAGATLTSRTVTLEPRPFRSSVKLTGFMAPLRVVSVVSPLEGHVHEKFFRYGAQVERGQRLFSVGIDETRVKHREARAAYINAQEELRKLQNWERGPEVVRARRALSRARLNLSSLRQKAEETKRLLELGIVPASEYQSQQEQLATANMEFRAAEDDLAHTLAQGGEEQVTVARLKLENATYQLDELQQKLDSAEVVAPVSGVVLLPAGSQAEEKRIEVGSAVQEGAVALSIGDLEGVSVRVSVDEIEIGRMRVGQKVVIRGEAFPGVELQGEVARVSSQASKAEGFGSAVPTFEIDVQVARLDAAQRARIRVGMSAELEVMVYDNPTALLVPLRAVSVGPGGSFVRVMDPGAALPREQVVETGLTSLDEVEIVAGLEPGARLVVDEGAAASVPAPMKRITLPEGAGAGGWAKMPGMPSPPPEPDAGVPQSIPGL